MTDAYIDFLEELFPAISPYTAQRAKDAVREFSRYGSKAPFFAEPLDEEFQQGDIFSKRELNFEKQSCCTKSCSGHRRNWGQDGFRIHPAPAFL